jgi:hypothetical protein
MHNSHSGDLVVRGPKALTLAEETELLSYAKEMAARQIPLERKTVMSLAAEMDRVKRPGAPFFSDHGPSDGWWDKFMKRHPKELSLRHPSKVHGGHTAMARQSVIDHHFQFTKKVGVISKHF